MMGLYNYIFGKSANYGKLFLKTSSTSANYVIRRVFVTSPTQYTYIDDNTGNVLYQGVFIGIDNSLVADLTQSTGSASLYIDVNDTGNGCTYFWHWINGGQITWLNMDVIPLTKSLWLSHSQHIVVAGKMLELQYFRTFNTTYNYIDFSYTTQLQSFHIQTLPLASLVQTFDIRNNPNLIQLIGANYDYTNINVANHRFLNDLRITDTNPMLDVNINTTYLPNLEIFAELLTYRDYDFNLVNWSGLRSLYIKANSLSNTNLLTSLIYLYIHYNDTTTTSQLLKDIPNLNTLLINSMKGITSLDLSNSPLNNLTINNSNNLTILDLRTLQNLTSFELQRNSGLTLIKIDNGLNNQITKFKRSWGSNTIDVKVDNSTDANNGVAPYLPTIWQEYLTYNSWNFI